MFGFEPTVALPKKLYARALLASSAQAEGHSSFFRPFAADSFANNLMTPGFG
jgi:hypothetical protein